MSKIIILKSLTDTINIKNFKYEDYFVESIKVTDYFNKYLELNLNSKKFFIKIINKIKNKYYKYMIVHELSYIIKEDCEVILSKKLKKYVDKIKDIFIALNKKYNISVNIIDEKVQVSNLVYKYIKHIENIHTKNIAIITKDINKIDKKMFLDIAKISKKVDFITKEVPKQNRIYKYLEEINEEYGMCNEIKNIKDLKDYLVVVNLDKYIENLQLFKYNKQSIYIDCYNIFTNEDYNYLTAHEIQKFVDKESLNLLKYMEILKNKNLSKNISFLYNEKEIYISELLYVLNKKNRRNKNGINK